MRIYLAIMAGGAIGSVARFALSEVLANRWALVPWGATVAVNVLGSFGIGLFAGLFLTGDSPLISPVVRAFVMIGIFGGFTTFSSFSLQTLYLAQEAQWLAGIANVLLSVFLCLIAVWLGNLCGVLLNNNPLQ